MFLRNCAIRRCQNTRCHNTKSWSDWEFRIIFIVKFELSFLYSIRMVSFFLSENNTEGTCVNEIQILAKCKIQFYRSLIIKSCELLLRISTGQIVTAHRITQRHVCPSKTLSSAQLYLASIIHSWILVHQFVTRGRNARSLPGTASTSLPATNMSSLMKN